MTDTTGLAHVETSTYFSLDFAGKICFIGFSHATVGVDSIERNRSDGMIIETIRLNNTNNRF